MREREESQEEMIEITEESKLLSKIDLTPPPPLQLQQQNRDSEEACRVTTAYIVQKWIVFFEGMSILFTLASCSIWVYLWLDDRAPYVLIDGCLDVLAYSVVIWCYMSENHMNSKKRDRRAQVCLAIIFLAASTSVKFVAMKSMVLRIQLRPSMYLICVSILQSLVFSATSMAKFLLSTKFCYSATLFSSGVGSLLKSLSSLSVALSMIFIEYNVSSVWFFDSLVGILLGLFQNAFAANLFISNFCRIF